LFAEASGADETCESFAFALVNGALGVFEVHGRRIEILGISIVVFVAFNY